MKIKVNIFTKETIARLRQNPEFRAKLEKIGMNPERLRVNLKRLPYIELDTGGIFDDFSRKDRAELKEILTDFLFVFGRHLLAAICFDEDIFAQGGKFPYGLEAIKRGLEEMARQIKTASHWG